MPAKPRPRLDERLDEEVRVRVLTFNRDFAARDELELDRFDLVSPFSRRILFTVRAATSSARPPYRPDFFALCLMCWY